MSDPHAFTFWPALLCLAVAAAVGGVAVSAWRARRRAQAPHPRTAQGLTPEDWQQLQQCVVQGEVGLKGLFTSEERQIFRQLRQAFPEWTILAKVPLSAVTEPLRPDWAPIWQQGLMHIRIDFALFSPNGRLLAAIECAGPTPAGRWPDWMPRMLEQLRVRHLVLTKGRPCTVLDLRRLLLTPDPKLDEWPVVPESLWGPFQEEAQRQLDQPSPALATPRLRPVAPETSVGSAPTPSAPRTASAGRHLGTAPVLH